MKVWVYLFIMTGLMILLKLAGLPAGADGLTSMVGITYGTNSTIQSVSLSNSSLFNEIFGSTGVLVLAIGAGIVAGLLTKQTGENLIMLPALFFIGTAYIGTLIGIVNYCLALQSTLVSSLLGLIFIPLTVGFIWSLFEHFRGTD